MRVPSVIEIVIKSSRRQLAWFGWRLSGSLRPGWAPGQTGHNMVDNYCGESLQQFMARVTYDPWNVIKLQLRPKIIEHLAKALGPPSHGWLVFMIPGSLTEDMCICTKAGTFCFLRPTAGDILSLRLFTRTALKALIHIRIYSFVYFPSRIWAVGYWVWGTFDIGQPLGTGSRFEDGRKFSDSFLFQFATSLSFFGLLVDTKVAVTLK